MDLIRITRADLENLLKTLEDQTYGDNAKEQKRFLKDKLTEGVKTNEYYTKNG